MIKKGKLIKWDKKKGFGFIQFDTEERQIFVHISAFPKNSGSPQLNESLAFQIGSGKEGKQAAVAIQLLDREMPTQKKPPKRPKDNDSNPIVVFIVFCVIVAGGVFVYNNINQIKQYFSIQTKSNTVLSNERNQHQIDVIQIQNDSVNTQNNYQCKGRTYCSQMTSCSEATWVSRHCPNTKMDGDRDGIPCEKQHCR